MDASERVCDDGTDGAEDATEGVIDGVIEGAIEGAMEGVVEGGRMGTVLVGGVGGTDETPVAADEPPAAVGVGAGTARMLLLRSRSPGVIDGGGAVVDEMDEPGVDVWTARMLLFRSLSPAGSGGVGAAEGRADPVPTAGDDGTALMLLLRSRSPAVTGGGGGVGLAEGNVEAGCDVELVELVEGTTRMLLCRSRSIGCRVGTGEGNGGSSAGVDDCTMRILLWRSRSPGPAMLLLRSRSLPAKLGWRSRSMLTKLLWRSRSLLATLETFDAVLAADCAGGTGAVPAPREA